MTKTVIALYDDFETGSRAVEALVDAGFDRDDISIVANDVEGRYSKNVTALNDDEDVSSGEGAGFGAIVGGLVGLGVALIPGIGPVLAAGPLAAAVMAGVGAVAGAATGGVVAGLVDLGVPEDEAATYAESIRRGGALVSVSVEDDAHVERAESILNRFSPVNIHERGDIYRQSGWSGYDVNAKPYSATEMNEFRSSYGRTSASAAPAPTKTVDATGKQKLEVVEEEVEVGKREVQDGTVRVHTRVTEKPVREQVNLHEERVTVERHPVNRAASPADVTAFQEATIEMTEKHEEPVVSKTARVVEEVTVGKEAQDRVETINETVRRKDVVVDGVTGTSTATTGWTEWEPRFRTHYNTNYAKSGTWESYSPAYRFGYDLANDQRYTGWSWDRIESDAQYRWEQDHPSTWENFKAAIRNAWDEIRGR